MLGAPMNAWNSPPPPEPPPTRARPRTVTAAARQPPPLGWPEGTEMLEDVQSLRRLRPLPDVLGALEVRGAPGPASDEHLPRLDVVQRVLVLLQVLQLGGNREGEHDDALSTATAAVVVINNIL